MSEEHIVLRTEGLPPRHRVDGQGRYLGTHSGLRRILRVPDPESNNSWREEIALAEPEAGAGETLIDAAPADARMVWSGTAWQWPHGIALIEKTAAVKAEAGRRIAAILPDYRQRNMLARGLELHARGASTWTDAERAEWEAGQALWSRIKAIRARSDEIEAGLATLAADEIASFDPAGASWPA